MAGLPARSAGGEPDQARHGGLGQRPDLRQEGEQAGDAHRTPIVCCSTPASKRNSSSRGDFGVDLALAATASASGPVEKVRDIVGLSLDPPERSVVLCVDEKSQIQALDRTQPVLPMRPGQVERRTQDSLPRSCCARCSARTETDVKAGTFSPLLRSPVEIRSTAAPSRPVQTPPTAAREGARFPVPTAVVVSEPLPPAVRSPHADGHRVAVAVVAVAHVAIVAVAVMVVAHMVVVAVVAVAVVAVAVMVVVAVVVVVAVMVVVAVVAVAVMVVVTAMAVPMPVAVREGRSSEAIRQRHRAGEQQWRQQSHSARAGHVWSPRL